MRLHDIKLRKTRMFKSKRIGRGYGSGKGGHTVGRGTKGQKSRSGSKSMLSFEGGNVPMHRRLPKFRGFRNINRVSYDAVNFSDLEKNYKADSLVDMVSLKKKGLIKKRSKYAKILGKGKLTKKLKFSGVSVSKQSMEVLKKLGCEFK